MRELVELLDQRAAREGVSRSQLIRDAITELLASDRPAEIDRRLVAGYTRLPQGGEYDADEWGDLDRQVTLLSADQLRHLDDEERQAGHEPW